METTEGTLVNLTRYLNHPNSAFTKLCFQEVRSVALYVQGLEYRSGEDHVSSVAAWVILRAPVGLLRRSFRTDGDVEPLVMEGEQTLADILA